MDGGQKARPRNEQEIEHVNVQLSTSKLGDNAAIVRSFLELAFNGRQPTRAAATYLGASYRQYNPMRSGAAAFVQLAERCLRAYPELRLTIQVLLADGDVVVTQSLLQLHPTDRGLQLTDTFELADGRIVRQWVVMQELPENAARAAA
jgi:predicted SnoaL-like aldol condensation-catalyzing enzyme